MLDSIPVLVQAVLWPLAGTVLLLSLGRFLPGPVQRLATLAAAASSMAALWSLGRQPAGLGGVALAWTPLDFFRMGPAFALHRLSLLAGLVLSGTAGLAALAVSGQDVEGRKTPWHALFLLELAGSLTLILAANVLTLALGSGLLLVAVAALAVLAGRSTERQAGLALNMALPGAAATLLIFLSALQADTQAGHASLQGAGLPLSASIPLHIAAVLWLLSFSPVRAMGKAESTAAFLPTFGAGLVLLARIQALRPVPNEGPYLLVGGVALVVGGLFAWLKRAWPGIAVHQAGYALVSTVLVAGRGRGEVISWPLVGVTLAVGMLAVGWSGSSAAGEPALWTALRPWLGHVEPWWAKLRPYINRPARPLLEWHGWTVLRRVAQILPAVGLASLAGLPLTAGAVGRWRLYATILHNGQAALLFAVLAADTLLMAGLWAVLRADLESSADHRAGPGTLAALAVLALPILIWGIAPNHLVGLLGLSPADVPSVSAWGLGLIFVLPWLAGSWLAFSTVRSGRRLEMLRRLAGLGWFPRGAAWAGRRLVDGVYWLSQVGEGEGWWGWALILLALGALFLAVP